MDYLTTARQCRVALTLAIAQARDGLPDAVIRQHWVVGHHSPAAWRSVETWYRTQAQQESHILDRLTDLALLSEALASILSITTEQGTTGSLKLAKVKRVEL